MIVTTTAGTRVSCARTGVGPPLVLVHGGFSDHVTNWEFVLPALRRHFTVLAVARRGRGGTDATEGHTVEDEGADVAAVVRAVGEPVFLLGHSYGAHCALAAALLVPECVRKLVLYEPPAGTVLTAVQRTRLDELAAAGAWDEFAVTFFRDVLFVPAAELEEVRASSGWPPILADARATLGDLRAFGRFHFDPQRARELAMPVLLQVGSESPRHLYATDALAAVLRDVRVEALPGQAHEGMTTAPGMYADAVLRFLLPGAAAASASASSTEGAASESAAAAP